MPGLVRIGTWNRRKCCDTSRSAPALVPQPTLSKRERTSSGAAQSFEYEGEALKARAFCQHLQSRQLRVVHDDPQQRGELRQALVQPGDGIPAAHSAAGIPLRVLSKRCAKNSPPRPRRGIRTHVSLHGRRPNSMKRAWVRTARGANGSTLTAGILDSG